MSGSTEPSLKSALPHGVMRVLTFALASMATVGCYESAIPRDPFDGGGISVKVEANHPRTVGFAADRVPVAGAHVIATRCDDGESREARTDASGIARLGFDVASCWTVTAVHPTLPYAVTHVAVDPSTDSPLLLAGDHYGGDIVDIFHSFPLTIAGRSTPDVEVDLVGDGVWLGRRASSAGVAWHTTAATVDAFADPTLTDHPRVFGFERDASGMPVSFGWANVDPTSTMNSIDIGTVRGPVISRSRSVALAASGAIDFRGFTGTKAVAYRYLADGVWTLGVGRGELASVERTTSGATQHWSFRELDVSGAVSDLLPTLDGINLEDGAGSFMTVTFAGNEGDLTVPPIERATSTVTSDTNFHVAMGGAGWRPSVTIIGPGTATSGPPGLWYVVGRADTPLQLDALPRLPAHRGLGAIRLAGLRGVTVRVSAGRVVTTVNYASPQVSSWGVTLPSISVPP